MAVATGLDKRELEVLSIMQDANTSSDTKFNDDLIKWAVETLQFYLAAGCDEREFIKRVPRLIGMLKTELAETADLCSETAETTRREGKQFGRDYSTEIAEDLEQAEAAGRLVDRMHAAERERR